MDIFEMRKLADNAVNSQIMRVGVENLNCDDFKIAIVESGKNVTEVTLFSDLARKLIVDALNAEIVFDKELMKKNAAEPDATPTSGAMTPTGNVEF